MLVITLSEAVLGSLVDQEKVREALRNCRYRERTLKEGTRREQRGKKQVEKGTRD